jgi:hypothetical protein
MEHISNFEEFINEGTVQKRGDYAQYYFDNITAGFDKSYIQFGEEFNIGTYKNFDIKKCK